VGHRARLDEIAEFLWQVHGIMVTPRAPRSERAGVEDQVEGREVGGGVQHRRDEA
jgi:hypothetical protein